MSREVRTIDKLMITARSHLKLAEQALKVRLTQSEQKPVGIISRENEIAHTRAVLAAVRHARFISDSRQDGWWDEPESVPF